MTVKHTNKIAVIDRSQISDQLYNYLAANFVRFEDMSHFAEEHMFSVYAITEDPELLPALRHEISRLIDACNEVGAAYVIFEN